MITVIVRQFLHPLVRTISPGKKVNDLYGWTMSEKLPVNIFELIEDTCQFNKYFIKNYNEESWKGFFLEVDDQYIEKLHELHNYLPFLPERMKIEKVEKLIAYFT